MFWVIAGLMTAGVLALLLRTLTGRPQAEAGAAPDEVDACRAQLAELERDVEAGLASTEDAAASRLEIERRLLRADERRQAEVAPSVSPAAAAKRRMAAVVVLMLMPLAAAGLYLRLGHPDMPGGGKQVREASAGPAVPGAAGENAPSLEVLVGRLEERLQASPEDAHGWSLLGRTYTVLGKYQKAAGAYRKAVALRPQAAELYSGLGEALALSRGGEVTPEALQVFEQAHALDPSDAASRFYLGVADYQRGKFQAALDAWVALAKDAPPDSPWLPDLRGRIQSLARELGVDPEPLLAQNAPARPPAQEQPAGRRGPSAEDMQAAAQMNPEDRQAMIRNMVSGLEARLEANPDDPEGWRMLARSYRILGEPEKAGKALGRLAALRPGDLSAQGEYALALVQRDEAKGAPLARETVAALRNVLRLEENNARALFYLGKAEARRGNRAEAERLWRRLIRHAPDSEPLRREAEALLKAGDDPRK